MGLIKVGTDLDDCVLDYVGTFSEFCRERYGTTFMFEDFTEYDFSKVMQTDREVVIRYIKEFNNSKTLLDTEPIPTYGEIEQIASVGQIIPITARPRDLGYATRIYLDYHFPGFFQEVNFSRDPKTKKRDYYNKARICKRLGIDVMIEDNLKYATACADAGVRTLLFDRPWNRRGDIANLERVCSYQEIIQKLKN